eukprot:TRINITY_DN19432_c0_g1_i1.p1 TRINITY_DN19432_c0_g1~~TRINITY_DN19432_c0_g1_i1.p1  ORF type:complete len:702 (+),score=235.85 TRINITY_DN19432_c0_g1_i1:44-2107(+)
MSTRGSTKGRGKGKGADARPAPAGPLDALARAADLAVRVAPLERYYDASVGKSGSGNGNSKKDQAGDLMDLVKTIFDVSKRTEPAKVQLSPLDALITEGLEDSQIWQELCLQNTPLLKYARKQTKKLTKEGDALSLLSESMEAKLSKRGKLPAGFSGDDASGDAGSMDGSDMMRQEGSEGDDDDAMFDDEAEEDEDDEESRDASGNNTSFVADDSKGEDQFFDMDEMEAFADGGDGDDDSVDLFDDAYEGEDNSSDDDNVERDGEEGEDDESDGEAATLKYSDFFEDPAPTRAKKQGTRGSGKALREAFENQDSSGDEDDGEDNSDGDNDDGSDASDNAKSKSKKGSKGKKKNLQDDDADGLFGELSMFARREAGLRDKVSQLEDKIVGDKPWQMQGEVTGRKRPQNSLLETDLEFEHTDAAGGLGKIAAAEHHTEETIRALEDVIKQRIVAHDFDDVEPKVDDEGGARRPATELNMEKSKLGLGDVYAEEYKAQVMGVKGQDKHAGQRELVEKLYADVAHSLDALANLHYKPRPPMAKADLEVTAARHGEAVSAAPAALTLEDSLPVSVSQHAALAPEQVFEAGKFDAAGTEGSGASAHAKKKRSRRSKLSKKERAASAQATSLLKARNVTVMGGGKGNDSTATKYSKSSDVFAKIQAEAQNDIQRKVKSRAEREKKQQARPNFKL